MQHTLVKPEPKAKAKGPFAVAGVQKLADGAPLQPVYMPDKANGQQRDWRDTPEPVLNCRMH